MTTALRSALLASLMFFLASCNGLSEESYDEVNVGMTLSEVESVLGKGEQDTTGGFTIGAGGTMGSSSSAGSMRQTYVWKDGNKQVVIEFHDQKVVSKRKIGF